MLNCCVYRVAVTTLLRSIKQRTRINMIFRVWLLLVFSRFFPIEVTYADRCRRLIFLKRLQLLAIVYKLNWSEEKLTRRKRKREKKTNKTDNEVYGICDKSTIRIYLWPIENFHPWSDDNYHTKTRKIVWKGMIKSSNQWYKSSVVLLWTIFAIFVFHSIYGSNFIRWHIVVFVFVCVYLCACNTYAKSNFPTARCMKNNAIERW